jgi:hypothetical protein
MNKQNNKLAHMAILLVPLWGWEQIIRSLLLSVGVFVLSKRVHIIMVIGHAEQTKYGSFSLKELGALFVAAVRAPIFNS